MAPDAKNPAKEKHSRPNVRSGACTFILGVYHCGLPRDYDRRPDPFELSTFTP